MTELAQEQLRVRGAHVRTRTPGRASSAESGGGHQRGAHPVVEDADEIAWSGRPLSELTLDAAREGRLVPDDLRIHPQTLERQAAVAARAGNVQLAGSLQLAAELTMLPDRELLALYDLLRPGGASLDALTEAERLLEGLGLTLAARHFRQAAQWYTTRGLIQ